MRLHCHDANTMFEFHFDLEHAAKIVDGDQRPVAQAAKAFLGNAQFDLGTIAGIPDVVIIEIIVVIPINVMPIVVIAVIVSCLSLYLTSRPGASPREQVPPRPATA